MDDLENLYQDIDAQAARLTRLHAGRLRCGRGCSACCVDDVTVYEIEARNIRAHHAGLLREGVPHAVGACAFLDDAGACRIYAQRPYVCRTQGLPLRWLEEDEAANEIYELRDICPLNETGPPIEALPPSDCWTLGPTEEILSQLQAQADGGQMRRVALRSLFSHR